MRMWAEIGRMDGAGGEKVGGRCAWENGPEWNEELQNRQEISLMKGLWKSNKIRGS